MSDDYDGPIVDGETLAKMMLTPFHPETRAYIEQLASTGLYGFDAREVVIGLVDEGIRNAIKNGFIKVNP